MTMPWGLAGPAFSYPTPYAAENRLLLARGAALLLLALSLWLLASISPDATSGTVAAWSEVDREPGSPWPVSLAAALFAVLGVINIVRAIGQRRLLLEPGQPAPLTGVLQREASGATPGAAWLQRALVNGAPEPLVVEGPWRDVLLRLAPDLGHWPRPLHEHLARRVYHLLLCAGSFALLAPVWLLAGGVTAAVAALGLGAIAVGVIGASAILPGRPAGGPRALAMWLLLGVVVVVAAIVLTPMFPWQDTLRAVVPLALPVALAALLWGLMLVEGLALLAGRAKLGPVAAGRIDSQSRELDAGAGLRAFAQELELELHRRWAEGVPSRRHAWQTPAAEGAGGQGTFSGVVLEESHPLLPAASRVRPSGWPRAGSPEMWLAALGLLCMAWTLMGGAFWLWQGWTYLHDDRAYWTKAGVGLALVVAAGHALRASHLLRSRFEVESTITWLELHGEWVRPAETSPATVQSQRARVAVAQARSVFYAAAPHRLGSRTLRSLGGDDAAAAKWLQTLQQLAQSLAHAQPAATEPRRARGGVPVPAPAVAVAQDAPPAPLAPSSPAVGRHCGVCSAAVPAVARFCPGCGSAVPQA
ncbi:MAG: hypothetical protein ACK5WT_09605 [Betaproteobacteria bacterium]